jgi:tRNA G18 (ribose-2'-O)-methylase SpoU
LTSTTHGQRPQLIDSLDDPLIASYRNVRERKLRDEGLFITEGGLLAERLLRSRFPVESLLVTVGHGKRYASLLPERVPLYCVEAALMREIVGFDFHRGVLGLGRRLPFTDVEAYVSRLLENRERQALDDSLNSLKLVACPGTETGENLGMVLRSAAAFGVQGVLLPTDGADPLSRRCLRQGMGSSLSLPIARSEDLLGALCRLQETAGLRLIAAVAPQSSAQSKTGGVIELQDFNWPARSVLVAGNEYQGLDSQWLQNCDYHVTIPISPSCDSLNVAVATGILLHHMAASNPVST